MGLDDDLRRLFASDDMDVPVRSDAEHVIVAGARRLRVRRIATAATGGAVAMVVVAGVVLAGGQPGAMPPADHVTATTTSSSLEVVETETESESPPPTGTSAEDEPDPTTSDSTEQAGTSTEGPAFPVVGPTGLADLTLGQTMEEAQATGMLGDQQPSGAACEAYDLLLDGSVVGSVLVSSTVQAISGELQTPEGIGPGSTLDQAEAQYSDLDMRYRPAVPDPGLASVPGNDDAKYRLIFGDSGEVITVTLESADQTCYKS